MEWLKSVWTDFEKLAVTMFCHRKLLNVRTRKRKRKHIVEQEGELQRAKVKE